ncbi:hypothetical protein ABZ297_42545 [Nonomuraea sp. NPDC005983]|uniref:hypothetical protein n=1 Tax=Nonomuraea sp. NPDC005983 TaxID=3155595 RepID=UPI00339F8675
MNERDTAAAPERVEYAGAVYGSLLAASVVAGTAEGGPPSPGDLVTLLICTGVVFWLAHVYARLVSSGYPARPLAWEHVRVVARREWPLAQASFPPAVVTAFVSSLGGSPQMAVWAALCVAVASQVAWAVAAAVKTRSSTRVVVISGVANLLLGLAIVALKTAVGKH